MIIDFSVRNFRSIKKLQTLSLVAAPIKSKNEVLDTNNIIPVTDKLSLLKSVAIYGANGSGKSNVVKALMTMLLFVRDSFKDETIGQRLINPFLLDEQSPKEPSYFQISFINEGTKYRYGFEVIENEIVSEWLFGTPDKKEVYYFTREGADIKINEKQFPEGKALADKTSKTNLFLNIAKAFNGQIAKSISDFFYAKVAISAGVNDRQFRVNTIAMLSKENTKKQILSLLNNADFGIRELKQAKLNKENLPKDTPIEIINAAERGELEMILSYRKIINDNGDHIFDAAFDLDNMESEGTKKMFDYSGVILRSLTEGKTLVLDEFDARLHPLLTKKLVELFNSPTLNKNKAQLIFVTHDTNLLDNTLLRRDQIYFTEKNSKSETELYSLADFKGIRNDASYEKDYIKGKYGAIPFLGDFEKLLD